MINPAYGPFWITRKIAAFGCGLFWGLLYSATDDLVAPAISHLLWDALLLFAFPVIRSIQSRQFQAQLRFSF